MTQILLNTFAFVSFIGSAALFCLDREEAAYPFGLGLFFLTISTIGAFYGF